MPARLCLALGRQSRQDSAFPGGSLGTRKNRREVFRARGGARNQGLRRTEFNFRGETGFHVAGRWAAKIEFCTSEPVLHKLHAIRTVRTKCLEPISPFLRISVTRKPDKCMP